MIMASNTPIIVTASASSRWTLPMRPASIRALVPASVIGAYVLLAGATVVYAGRSDTCIRRRLAAHPLLGVASHALVEPCASTEAAFLLECFWFHALLERGACINKIHPAHPAGVAIDCPHCCERVGRALARAVTTPPPLAA